MECESSFIFILHPSTTSLNFLSNLKCIILQLKCLDILCKQGILIFQKKVCALHNSNFLATFGEGTFKRFWLKQNVYSFLWLTYVYVGGTKRILVLSRQPCCGYILWNPYMLFTLNPCVFVLETL